MYKIVSLIVVLILSGCISTQKSLIKSNITIGKPVPLPKTVNYTNPNFKPTKPFVQAPNAGIVHKSCITHSYKYVVTAVLSSSVFKLRDIKNNILIKTFHETNGNIDDLAITPDDKYILSITENGSLKLWDIATGNIVKTFNKHDESITIGRVAITPDGKYALSSSSKNHLNRLTLWDIKSGKKIKSFPTNRIDSMKVTPDGKYIIAISSFYSYLNPNMRSSVLQLIDINTGKIVREFEKLENIMFESFSISANGKYLYSLSADMIYSYISVWDMKTGNKIKTLKKQTAITSSIDISPDGNYIFLINNKGGDSEVKVFNLLSGKEEIKYLSTHVLYNITFLPDSNQIVFFENGSIISLDLDKKLNDKLNKKNISTINEPSNIKNIDKKTVLIRTYKTIEIWNTKEAKRIKSYGLNGVSFLSIMPDKKTFFISIDKKLRHINLETGKVISTFEDEKKSFWAIKTSNDGKYVVTLTSPTNSFQAGSYNLNLWNVKTTKHIHDYKINEKIFIPFIYITPDNKYLLYSGSQNMTLWDLHTANQIWTLKHPLSDITQNTIVSHDGKYIFTAKTNKIDVYDLYSSVKIKTIKLNKLSYTNNLLITSDNKYILKESGGNTQLIDITNGKMIRNFKVDITKFTKINFTDNNKYIYYISTDGSIRYIDISTGKEVLQTISFSDGEWISITPEGYFNASANGAKHLSILTGPMEVSSIDQYYETFYRPDIVASAMTVSRDIQYTIDKPTLKLSDIKPAPQVAIIDTKESINKEELKVTLRITPSSGGIGQIRLYLDGVLIKTDGDRGLKKKQDKNIVLKSYTIKLPKGEHTIKAIVYNESNTMASREDTLTVISTYSQITKPNIYAVVIGINKYKNPAINLKYAVADAKLFAKTIKANTKGLYKNVKIKLLINRKQTSKVNIIKALKELENISPNDLFIFYVASHGMIENAKYHMITSNVGALSSRGVKKEAISQDTLRDMLANIPSTKKFIVLDTCNSGALGQSLEVALLTRGLTETTAMKVLSRAVGSTIISASSSAQEALEGYKGHGLLTYVLSDGLKGKADTDGDGYIKTLEIANFVEDNVPEIAERKFKRAQYPYISPLGQGFPLVQTK